jgi:hypothetical protein
VQTNMIPTSTHASGTDYKFRVLISKVNNSLLRNHSLQHFPPLSHPSSSTNNYNFPIRYSSVAANEHRNTKSMKCSETLQTHHDIRIHTPTNETTGKIPVIMAMTMFTKNHSNRLVVFKNHLSRPSHKVLRPSKLRTIILSLVDAYCP